MKNISKKIDSCSEHLFKLKRFYIETPFFRKGLFSLLTFGAFAVMGILPVLPQTEATALAAEKVPQNTEEEKGMSTSERCYWQKDVRLFTTLQESKERALVSAIPCEEAFSQGAVKKDEASEETLSAVPQEASAPIPSAKGNETLAVDLPVSSILSVSAPSLETLAIPSSAPLEDMIREMTAGFPLEVMAPAIAKYDTEIAGLIVGIAKKESNWGKRVPLDKAGADCFNYWGYKGAGTRGVAMGHGCFGTPEEAVSVIGNRLQKLVSLRETSAPANMIIWKCGSSCAGHSPESVQKWISDVSLYYNRIVKK